MTEPPPLVRWRDVAFQYPGANNLALQPTSMDINVGESVSIVGRSGSGKSTLLSLLGLLDRPTLGMYELDGVATNGLRDHERSGLRSSSIGFVFQAFHLLDHLSVNDNIALGLRYQNVSDGLDIASLVNTLLERIGLAGRGADRPTKLSGGERQRVAIARAVIGKPSLLLADEPTGNLDSKTSHTVLQLFDELRAELQLSLVIVTHNSQLADTCDRTIRVVDGQIAI